MPQYDSLRLSCGTLSRLSDVRSSPVSVENLTRIKNVQGRHLVRQSAAERPKDWVKSEPQSDVFEIQVETLKVFRDRGPEHFDELSGSRATKPLPVVEGGSIGTLKAKLEEVFAFQVHRVP